MSPRAESAVGIQKRLFETQVLGRSCVDEAYVCRARLVQSLRNLFGIREISIESCDRESEMVRVPREAGQNEVTARSARSVHDSGSVRKEVLHVVDDLILLGLG